MKKQNNGAQRARWFLRTLSVLFLLIALVISFKTETSPSHAAAMCFLLAGAFIGVERFGSEKLIRRMESLLTGW